MNTVQVIALSLALAFLAESMVEYLFGTLFDYIPAIDKYKPLLKYISMLVGIGVCWFYQADLVSLITEQGATVLGIILTGLIVGRGANFVHQFVSTYLPVKK